MAQIVIEAEPMNDAPGIGVMDRRFLAEKIRNDLNAVRARGRGSSDRVQMLVQGEAGFSSSRQLTTGKFVCKPVER